MDAVAPVRSICFLLLTRINKRVARWKENHHHHHHHDHDDDDSGRTKEQEQRRPSAHVTWRRRRADQDPGPGRRRCAFSWPVSSWPRRRSLLGLKRRRPTVRCRRGPSSASTQRSSLMHPPMLARCCCVCS